MDAATHNSLDALLETLSLHQIELTLDQQKLRFNAPKGAMNKAMRQQIIKYKEDIIQRFKDGSSDHPIPRQKQHTAPLSAAQKRLWFLDQLEQGKTATYNLPPMVWKINGHFNVNAVQDALDLITQRHSVLSAAFSLKDKQPVQTTSSKAKFHTIHHNLTLISKEEQKIKIGEIIQQQAETPFQLDLGEPLFRVTLLKRAETEYIFILVMHHIIADGWSIAIFLDEFFTLYNACHQHLPSPLPPLPIQYGDFARWEADYLKSPERIKQRVYWREKLHNTPTLLTLPTDYPRPKIQRFHGRTETLLISQIEAHKINQFCLQNHITLFMFLLTTLSILLSRYSQQDDLVIGSPISHRPHPQTEKLMGLFLNTLALRIQTKDNPRFIDLLKQVKQTALEAYQNQDLPYDQLLDVIQLERNLNHTPLFQVMLVLQNTPEVKVEFPGLSFTSIPSEQISARVDLTLSVEESRQGLTCHFRYNRDLFSKARIKRMQGHFKTLLDHAIKTPEQKILHLPLLTQEEEQQLIQWNQTDTPYPLDRCLHHTFEQQVELTPEAIALCFEDKTLSYKQFNQKANQLAHYLRRVGVDKEVLVGLCMERSLEMLIGLYGIVKAGGAYVPLDPEYPKERLAFMLEDIQSPVLLTQRHLIPKIETITTNIQIIALDDPKAIFKDLPKTNPSHNTKPHNLAYTIYTSGSTGKPKGAMNSHLAICNRLFWMQERFPLDHRDRVLQKTPYSFDVSVWEFFWPLMYGAQLVIAKPEGHKDSAYLIQLIQQQKITTLHFVPSMLQVFLEDPQVEKCQTIRQIICSGEALRFEQKEKTKQYLPHVALHNLYGPTEAAVDVSHWPCDQPRQDQIIPIGQPIANIQLHILDPSLQPVPIGIPGELHIAGIGVARGYLNREALTKEKFIPNPFSTGDHNRVLYKTGDMVRYLEDGHIEYLDRIDFQVKIHGFRIELGEIENVLIQYEDIINTVVIAWKESDQAAPFLVAYLVTQSGEEIVESAIRQFLAKKLTDYMIPKTFIRLEEIPLNHNGKVDRRALPDPTTQRTITENNFTSPSNPMEIFIADLWCDVLGREKIGIHDHFFEMGGDSIKGAILINKLQKIINKLIYVVAIFEAPTIAQFITYMKQHYPESLEKIGGKGNQTAEQQHKKIDPTTLKQFQKIIPPLKQTFNILEKQNPPAIFILSPPRSGSTLLRIMLGGHPQIFAPPELELLSFNDLNERKNAYTGRNLFSLEGTERALMAIHQCTPEEAKAMMHQCEQESLNIQQFYQRLQEGLKNQILVDKSPAYALDINILKRAESYFKNARFIHLLRSPYGMINSFEEAKLHQVFFRYPHQFTVRSLAELIWLQSHKNILQFLSTIPKTRQHKLHFEELTQQPKPVIEDLCDFLEIDFSQAMLQPYQERKDRMADGLFPESKMLGDAKFHSHKKIQSSVAERWRQNYQEDFLSQITWEVAETLGYDQKTFAPQQQSINFTALTKKPATKSTPLSFSQQRLWFLNQLEGDQATYNMPVALRLTGTLDEETLHRSLSALIKRHESLRSIFPDHEGQPIHRLINQDLKLNRVDLSQREDIEKEIQYWLEKDSQEAFNLTTGPLFRCTLIICDKNQSILLINMHHLISDGWSMGILVREWSLLYNAYLEGKPSPLPKPTLQYSDYAYWQQQHMTSTVLQKQLRYWQKRLHDIPTLLELPTDFPRPPEQKFNGAVVTFSITKAITSQLKQTAKSQDASLFMALLSLFATLLSRYTRSEDIVIGTPSANRQSESLENVIGFFVNTLVMRLDLADQPSFEQLLRQSREVALEAYQHQDIPFEKLVEALQPERNLSHSPLFQVMLVLQNAPMNAPKLSGLNAEIMSYDHKISKFDLTLIMEETKEGMVGTLEYNCDLFKATTMQRLCGHFQTLIQSALKKPQQPVDQLTLLTPEERETFKNWNQTAQNYPHTTLAQQIETQCGKTPDKIALWFKDQSLSYAELNQQANQLAHYLYQRGIKRGMIIALYLERSPEMVTTLLAILKVGAAYLPMDPSFPAKRLAFMLEDANVPLVITHSDISNQLIDIKAEKLHLDQLDLTTQPVANLPQRATAEDLAYVIYTSGSTGKPKGVMISQKAAINFLWSMKTAPGFTKTDRLLAVTTISFDISVLELYLPLMVGGEVILADSKETHDAIALLDLLKRYRITIMQATPATWRMLLTTDWLPMPDLKILCGGEALPIDLAEQLLKQCGALWNMYGPTETTVWSTIAHVTEDHIKEGLSIGYPIANTTIHILDHHHNPLPVGVAGELFIGGDGLAEGYMNRDQLTREKFIINPFNAQTRLYRTGDLVCYRENGSLTYKNRIDNQVKIRGFRIELGEIEKVLSRHESINTTVVVIDQTTGEDQLVAYIVFKKRQEATTQTLRGFLKQHLPDYMVPAFFIPLTALPLTPNGKINRRALPKPHEVNREPQALAHARDTTELQLIGIWEALLNRSPIGVQDDFFDLGGHSLIAVQLMAKINQHFRLKLPLATLFQGATIEQLASIIDQKSHDQSWSSLVTIQPSGEKKPLFCIAGAGGNVLYFHALAQQMGKTRPFYGLQPPGLDGTTPPYTDIEDLAAHYIQTIKTVQPHGPYILGGHSFGGLVAFEMHRQLQDQGEYASQLILLDTPAPHHYQPTEEVWSESRWLTQVAEIIGHLYGQDLKASEEDFAAKSPDKQLDHLHMLLKKHEILSPDADIQQLQGFINVYKANLQARYTPPLHQEKSATKTLFFHPEEIQPEALLKNSSHPPLENRESPQIAWRRYITIDICQSIPGDHLTMLNRPHVDLLADHLQNLLK
ncbi:amino acid adenylation domain-containing protein [Magnetococcales bacterium HHB-1]